MSNHQTLYKRICIYSWLIAYLNWPIFHWTRSLYMLKQICSSMSSCIRSSVHSQLLSHSSRPLKRMSRKDQAILLYFCSFCHFLLPKIAFPVIFFKYYRTNSQRHSENQESASLLLLYSLWRIPCWTVQAALNQNQGIYAWNILKEHLVKNFRFHGIVK